MEQAKGKIMRILMSVLFCVIIVLGSACSGSPENRGRLDMEGVHVMEIGQDSTLETNRTFGESKKTTTETFTFTRANDVQSFRYRAYHNGTYKFHVEPACKFEVYVHSGSIVTDWWQEAPCDKDLSANYEYTIEVRVTTTDHLNQPINLIITTPNLTDQDITGCRSFVDDYNGDLEYYTFTAPRDGKYTFTIKGVNAMDFLNSNGTVIDYTGWDSWSKEMTKGYKLTIKIKRMDFNKGKLYGYIEYPTEVIDVTDVLEEHNLVAFKFTPMWAGQSVDLVIKPSESKSYTISNTDVGVQEIVSQGCFGEVDYMYSTMLNYAKITYQLGDNKPGSNGIITTNLQSGEQAKIMVTAESKLDEKERWLTICKKGAVKEYLPYES